MTRADAPPTAVRVLLLALLVVAAIVGVLAWPTGGDTERPSLAGDGARLDARHAPAEPLGAAIDVGSADVVPLEVPTHGATKSSPGPAKAGPALGGGLRLVVEFTAECGGCACEIAEAPPLVLTRPVGRFEKKRPSRPRGDWKDLAAGSYRVRVGDPAWSGEALEVELAPTTPVTRLALSAEPRTRLAGTITIAATGEAPDEALVVLESDAELGVRHEGLAHPDPSGAFCLVGWTLPDATRRVRAIASVDGHSPAVGAWIDVPDPRAFALTDLAFVLGDEAVLTGRIVDASSGRPLVAKVGLAPTDLRPARALPLDLAQPVRTDLDGRYRLATRAPVDVALVVEPRTSAWISDPLHLEPGETRVLDVSLAGPASLVGRVLVEDPASGVAPSSVRVSALSSLDLPGSGQRVDVAPDGSFAFTDLPACRVLVMLVSNERLTLGTREVVLVSGETSEVTFEIGAPNVRGRVFGAAGARLTVICRDLGFSNAFGPVTKLDEDGRFAFPVPAGEHLCVVVGEVGGEGEAHAVVPFVVPADGSAVIPLEIDLQRTRLELVPDAAADASASLQLIDPWVTVGLYVSVQAETGHTLVDRLLTQEPLVVRGPDPLVLLGLPAGRYLLTWEAPSAAYTLEASEFVLRAGVPERVVPTRRDE